MIPFDFEYYKPDTVEEAVRIYNELDSQGKNPLYYSGGSEIISMARVSSIHPGAVIDLKGISECKVVEFQGDVLAIGSCVSLSQITESKLFPLLRLSCGRIADHTMQCRITLGGNISGTIIYREAVLPLLLSDCSVMVAGSDGLRQLSIHDAFNERLRLSQGEFLVSFMIGKEFLSLPFVHVKKTKSEKIDYPLVSVAAVKKEDRIRMAMSGVCGFPFRSTQVEDDLNDKNSSWDKRAANVLTHLPGPVMNDISGSDNYRKFVLKETLINTLATLEGIQ